MNKFLVVSLGIAGLLGTAATSVAADAPAAKAEAPKADAAKPEGPKVSQKAIDAGKKIDWSKMDENAKKKYMKSTVLPEMKKLFVAVDKKHYAAMNCQTCHGEKAVENKFKMPNPTLPKLPQPTDRAGFMALQQKKPDIVKFMGTQVKPTMAALLGKAEWEPNNPTGFGCYGGHTQEGPAAPAPGTPAAPGKPSAPPAPAKGGW
jgi:cytochrome c553